MKYPKGVVANELDEDRMFIREKDIVRPKIEGHDAYAPAVRGWGNFEGLGYFLDKSLDWVIVEDNGGYPVLVALKKRR